jgi:hypothetical protein
MSALDLAEVTLSESVTVTSTVRAVWLGAVAVILVELVLVALAVTVPNMTVTVEEKFVPVITTPAVVVVAVPEAGLKLVTVGGARNVKWTAWVDATAPSCTKTVTWPAACAGDVTVIDLELFTTRPDVAWVDPK